MHYFLIAGEASGDLHGAHLINSLRERDSEAHFTFLGGDKMAEAAGTSPVVHYRDMAFMGFSEVIRNLGKVRRNFGSAKRALRESKPDCLILIDYPSFNLKIARTAKKLGIPTYYFIAPKVWAWKKWRVKDIRRLTLRVLSILPFEPKFFEKYSIDATYVGNPSVAEVDADLARLSPRAEFLSRHRLRDRQLIALMPGSRVGEIRNNLPVMLAAVRQFPQYLPIIVKAPSLDSELYKQYGSGQIALIEEPSAVDILAHCRAALVTSGTATLECALCGIPQVVCYRANGSKIAYKIMSKVLSVRFVSLPNLIVDREIIPEQLLHLCTPDIVADTLHPLLRDTPQREAQLDGYRTMHEILGTKNAPNAAAEIIVADF